LISACGGGGGSSSPSTFSATTTGVAAKGIIKNVTVTAKELSATGATLRTVGTADTDASGKYTLTIGSSYTGGPIKLVLSVKSDGTTKMVCDVSTGCGAGVAFGADYSLSPTFTLTSYQQAASNGAAITTQITPYTNMAAARIDAQINAITPVALDNTLVSNANSEVSQLVGVNITTTQPVDITNPTALAAASPDALQYAAFNAGIGNVAFASAGGFEAGITAAANSFADGQFTSTDPVTIGNIVTAVDTEANALTTTGLNTTVLTATLFNITANTTSGTYNPESTPAAALSGVAQAKALVSQTRTWVTQIKSLKTPADAFKLDVDTAQTVLNSSSVGVASVFGKVLKGAIDTVRTEANSASGLKAQSYSYPLFSGAMGIVLGTGTVTVSNNAGSLKLAFSSVVAGVTNSGTITTSIPSSVLNAPFTNFDLAGLSLVMSGNATMSTPAVSFTLTNASINVALKPSSATVNTATVLSTDIASLDIDGNASLQASGVTFTGMMKLGVVANNVVNAVQPYSLSEISLDGTFTGSKGSANAAFSIKINNAATFDVFGLLQHQPVVGTYEYLPGDPFGLAAKFAAATGGDTLQWGNYSSYNNQTCWQGLVVRYQCVSGDPYGVVATVTADIAAKHGNLMPISVQNVSSYYSAGYGTSYSAMLTFPKDFETASNFANATITMSSQVALAGYPAATVTYTGNRTAFGSTAPDVGDYVAILSFNGQSVQFVVSNTVATPTIYSADLTITNPSGVKLVIGGVSTTPTGTMTVGATQVGTIESSSGITMIHYSDGSFEALQ
ncbi:MAG: hypothetical protein ABL902_06790, partial [Gallionella sp.]